MLRVPLLPSERRTRIEEFENPVVVLDRPEQTEMPVRGKPGVERAGFGADEIPHSEQTQRRLVVRIDIELPVGAEMRDALDESLVLRGKKRIESLRCRQTAMAKSLRERSSEVQRQPIFRMPAERLIDARIQPGNISGRVISAERPASGVETLAGPELFILGGSQDQERG